MAANVKISQLPNINANLSNVSLIPIVSTNGAATTDKTTVQQLGNYIQTEAGNLLAPAGLANLSYNVVNAAQPNITSVGTLTGLNVVGTSNIGYPNNVVILGGTAGQVLATFGEGSLGWVDQTGATGATGPQGDRYSTTSTTTLSIATGNVTLTVETGLAYTVGQDITVSHDSNNYMAGPILTYDDSDGTLVFDSITIDGSGSYSTWTVNLDGAAGGIGATGATGIAGPTGATGIAGIVESNSAPVDTTVLWLNTNTPGTLGVGATGATGPAGTIGVDGATGSTGATGPIGATGSGSTGATGVAGIVESNTAPSDTSVIWLNTNTSGTLGVGATGATGPAGTIGVDGSTGATGAAGTDGATGATGPQGDTGATGVQGATGIFGGALTQNLDGNNFNITNVATFSANTLQGTSPNVTLTAGSFSATFDNTGVFTLPTVGGDEGGEINLGIPASNTTLVSPVKVDVFQDRIRFFDGSTKGAYIDLNQAAAGVGTLINNRVSGYVNAGTFVTMDNLTVTVTTSGNRGLSIATVSGSFSAFVSGSYTLYSGGLAGQGTSLSVTTTPSTSLFGWNFLAQGDTAVYIINDATNNRAYRVTMMIGGSYNNNMISIERLI